MRIVLSPSVFLLPALAVLGLTPCFAARYAPLTPDARTAIWDAYTALVGQAPPPSRDTPRDTTPSNQPRAQHRTFTPPHTRTTTAPPRLIPPLHAAQQARDANNTAKTIRFPTPHTTAN